MASGVGLGTAFSPLELKTHELIKRWSKCCYGETSSEQFREIARQILLREEAESKARGKFEDYLSTPSAKSLIKLAVPGREMEVAQEMLHGALQTHTSLRIVPAANAKEICVLVDAASFHGTQTSITFCGEHLVYTCSEIGIRNPMKWDDNFNAISGIDYESYGFESCSWRVSPTSVINVTYLAPHHRAFVGTSKDMARLDRAQLRESGQDKLPDCYIK